MSRGKKILFNLGVNKHRLYIFGPISTVLFITFTVCTIFPITNQTKNVEATTTPATATLNITSTSDAANIELKLKHKSDAFAASSKNLTFNISTNNL